MTDTLELIRRAKRGDDSAYEEIVKANSPLVWSIVKRFIGRGTETDDLYQLGCIGLIKAVHGFDESLGNCFSTYAVPKISGEIRRFLRDDGVIKVSRTLKEQANKIRSISELLQTRLGREPTLSEISEESGLTIEEIAQAECATAPTDSLNREIGEDGKTVEDTLSSLSYEDKALEYIALNDAIAELDKKSRLVIMLRFFKCLTQQQTAKVMNISQVQVSRIERAAIEHLKEKIVPT